MVRDSDYRWEVQGAMHDDSSQAQESSAGERIAQLILQFFPYVAVHSLKDQV